MGRSWNSSQGTTRHRSAATRRSFRPAPKEREIVELHFAYFWAYLIADRLLESERGLEEWGDDVSRLLNSLKDSELPEDVCGFLVLLCDHPEQASSLAKIERLLEAQVVPSHSALLCACRGSNNLVQLVFDRVMRRKLPVTDSRDLFALANFVRNAAHRLDDWSGEPVWLIELLQPFFYDFGEAQFSQYFFYACIAVIDQAATTDQLQDVMLALSQSALAGDPSDVAMQCCEQLFRLLQQQVPGDRRTAEAVRLLLSHYLIAEAKQKRPPRAKGAGSAKHFLVCLLKSFASRVVHAHGAETIPLLEANQWYFALEKPRSG